LPSGWKDLRLRGGGWENETAADRFSPRVPCPAPVGVKSEPGEPGLFGGGEEIKNIVGMSGETLIESGCFR